MEAPGEEFEAPVTAVAGSVIYGRNETGAIAEVSKEDFPFHHPFGNDRSVTLTSTRSSAAFYRRQTKEAAT